MSSTEIRLEDAAILLQPNDDVAVAKRALAAGTVIDHDGAPVRLSSAVQAGHKFAVQEVRVGAPVHKYGHVIGFATARIRPGDRVHTHNLGFGVGQGQGDTAVALQHEYSTSAPAAEAVTQAERRTFAAYRRGTGRVGTRNYVAVISTVNCSAAVVRGIADAFRHSATAAEFPNVDGVVPFTHATGCGQSVGGADYRQFQRTLAGIARHPNVAAYILVGLGCETNQALALAHDEGLIRRESVASGRSERPVVISIQDEGGVQKAVGRGVEETARLLRWADTARRTPEPVSELIVGTNCGGSDGASGITANPALGIAGDKLVRQGGGWVLAETPETYGAEHLLTRRAVSRSVGEKLVALMRWWEWYTGTLGASIDSNPTPGNKEGGITTIYEKALGAVAKAGNTALVDVYRYAEPIDKKGLTFMDTPGLDPVSVTGLVAGGCTLVAFTTGRGSCLGFKPAPVVKIASNTPLYARMRDDMDVDAGVVLDGVPIADVGHHIFETLIEVAGGRKTKSEAQGLGETEFAPWILGPVM